MRHVLQTAALAVSFAALSAGSAVAGPTFVFNDTSWLSDLRGSALTNALNVQAQSRIAFEQAATIWGSHIQDDVTIRININNQAMSLSTLAATGSHLMSVGYSAFRTALQNDDVSGSAADLAADRLPEALTFYSNDTCGSSLGCLPISRTTRALDDDNTFDNNNLLVNTSVMKAVGLMADDPTEVDATIYINRSLKWDWDPSDGITTGFYDFLGLALHEMGHALGFISGVDFVDSGGSAARWDGRAWGNALDLFRYKLGTPGVLDWTVGTTTVGKTVYDPCLSLDNGLTCASAVLPGAVNGAPTLALLSGGAVIGRSFQASHWKSASTGTPVRGLMAPRAFPGVAQNMTTLDLLALDAIGWNIDPLASPPTFIWTNEFSITPDYELELIQASAPGSAVALMGAVGALAVMRRRRR